MELKCVRKATLQERISSYIIDSVFYSILIVPITFIILFNSYDKLNTMDVARITIVILFIFLLKDIFGGRSIGKRFVKIGVRNVYNPNTVPKPWLLVIRNVPLLIWPIEFLVMLSSSKAERFGDLITKTVVCKLDYIEEENSVLIKDKEYLSEKDTGTVSKNKKMIKVASIFVTIILVTSLFVFSIMMFLKNSTPYKIAIENIESNEEVYDEIGDVIGYGFITQGSLTYSNNWGDASFKLKVKGEKGNCYVYIVLSKKPYDVWKVDYFKILK